MNNSLKIKAEYVSLEDFKTYTGIDLIEELPEGRDAELFLRDAEDELIEYANAQSWRPISRWLADNKLPPEDVNVIREAIIMQAKYMFENGDALANNGLDPETGVKFGSYERDAAAISPKAIKHLKNNGILTLRMKTRY